MQEFWPLGARSALPLTPVPALVVLQPFKTSSTKKILAFVMDDAGGKEGQQDVPKGGEEGRQRSSGHRS